MQLEWVVTVDPDGTPTVLTDVQNIQLMLGVRKISDPPQRLSGVISGRDIDNLPSIPLYTKVLIESYNTANNALMLFYSAYVTDVTLEYGIVPNQDTWSIALNDGIVFLSTITMTSGSLTNGDTLENALSDFVFALPGYSGLSYGGIPNLRVSGVNFAGQSAKDVLTKLCNTGGLQYSVRQTDIVFSGPYAPYSPPETYYSDDGSGTFPVPYNSVKFTSVAENYAPDIRIEPNGLAAVSVGSGQREQVFETYNFNSAEATDIAYYYQVLYGQSGAVPSEISTLFSMLPDAWTDTYMWRFGGVTIKLRGATYNTFVCGEMVSATPDDTRYTLFLYERDQQNYLVLDDATFGKLDENRLGV